MQSPPRQARSRETLRRLLTAAETLFDEQGFQAATVPEICRQAQSSTGAFYKRFRDKDELLSVLFSDLIDQIQDQIERDLDPGAVAGQTVADLTRTVIGDLAAIFRRRAGLFRVLAVVSETRPDFLQVSDQVYAEVTRRLQAVLTAKRAQFAHPDPPVAAAFAADLVVAVLQQKVQIDRRGGSEESWPAMERELIRAVLGYLGTASGPPNEE